MNSPQQVSSWWRWWTVGCIAMIGAVVGTMFWLRQSAIADMSSPKSISDWQAWREDVREQQTNGGPVERRVPRSDEPPALVLMRDYFVVMIVGATLFSTVLYWIMAWFITGILKSR